MTSTARTLARGIAVCTVLIMGLYSSVSPAHRPQRFLYGPWGTAYPQSDPPPPQMRVYPAAVAGSDDFTQAMNILQDTLGFNMAFAEVFNHATAESLINRGFKVLEFDSSYEPGKPGDFAQGWYLTWQTDAASVPPWYQGSVTVAQGMQTIDAGDTVWAVGGAYGGSRGWMLQTGGGNYKFKDPKFTLPQQHADFRLKADGVSSSDTVAVIYSIIQWYPLDNTPAVYDTVARDTLYGSDFSLGIYGSHTVSWPQPRPAAYWNDLWAYYSVFWFGRGRLFFDEVLSRDDLGNDVIDGRHDVEIDAYTNKFTYGTNGSYLLGWYLMDERSTPEQFACWERVNQRLRSGVGGKGGFEQWSDAFNAWSASEMLNVDWLMSISYLATGSHCDNGVVNDAGATSYSTDSPGGDSVSLQTTLNDVTSRFRRYKLWADSGGKVFWPMIASWQYFSTCGGNCYETARRATGYELRAHAGLALAYGADALGLWHWGWDACYIDGFYPRNQGYYDIRDMVSPLIDSLGDLFYDLKWLGADSSQAVSTIPGSFVDSIRSVDSTGGFKYARPYVEAGFFQDTLHPQDQYFMLVNRRCLAVETQNVQSWLSVGSGMFYVIDKYSYDTVLTGPLTSGRTPFTTTLGPGQWKLFKIVPTGAQYVSGNSFPKTWQGGIRVGGNAQVDTNRTLTILAPADIKIDSGGGYTLSVFGTLLANGTARDTITFRSGAVPASTARQNWTGIELRGPGNLSLNYACIRNAYKAAWIEDWSAGVDTVTIDHCDFRREEMAGVWIDADPSSAVSVTNSHFNDIHWYGVQVFQGKPVIQSNRFADSMNPAINVAGYSGRVTGGTIKGNTIDSLTNPYATGVYLQTVYNDGNSWSQNQALVDSNTFGPTWSSSNQTAIYVYNCTDTLLLRRNAIKGANGWPGYGINNYSTRTLINGDLSQAESLSTIRYAQYGIYCFSSSSSDPDYAKVRYCSIDSRGTQELPSGYGVWVYSNSKVDLGKSNDSGKNAFYGYHFANCDPQSMLSAKFTVYNNRTTYTDSAIGNYWFGQYCGKTQDPYWPFLGGAGAVNTSSKICNPWTGCYLEKVAAPAVGEMENGARQIEPPKSWPNPFNSSTVIQVDLVATSAVEITIYNILGQQVRTLWNGDLDPGIHQFPWDGHDDVGNQVSSGVYLYKVASAGSVVSKKMVVLK